MFDKFDLLTRVARIDNSLRIPDDAQHSIVSQGKIPLLEPIVSYLTGDMITEVDTVSTVVRAVRNGVQNIEVYLGYQYIESIGRSPIFFNLEGLENYLTLMTSTSREIPMNEISYLDEVFLSETRTGIYGVMKRSTLRSFFDAAKGLDDNIRIKSVRCIEDIFDLMVEVKALESETGDTYQLVRLSMNAWVPMELKCFDFPLDLSDPVQQSYFDYLESKKV